MKIKYIFLVIFVFIVNPLIFSINITEEKAVLVGYNTIPSRFWNEWNMLSSFNGNAVIYVSDSYYIDAQTLEFVNYFTPFERYWFSVRPPFSTNIMPCVDLNWNFIAVNIETNEYELIPDDFDTYFNFLLDNDRQYNSATIHAPEYSVTIESDWLFWFVGKDHRQIPTGNWSDWKENDNNNRIKDILLSDFQGTVFDNNYWLETFDNLFSSFNIITKHKISLDRSSYLAEWNINGNGPYYTENYLTERINSYFNINITDLLNDYFRINIYENGFFVYNSDKIILFDIKNDQIISYIITEYNIPERSSFEIIVQNKNNFFIIFENDRDTLGVYKLECN
jgi:hypothetical protein